MTETNEDILTDFRGEIQGVLGFSSPDRLRESLEKELADLPRVVGIIEHTLKEAKTCPDPYQMARLTVWLSRTSTAMLDLHRGIREDMACDRS